MTLMHLDHFFCVLLGVPWDLFCHLIFSMPRLLEYHIFDYLLPHSSFQNPSWVGGAQSGISRSKLFFWNFSEKNIFTANNDFLCNTQSLELFPRNLREDFFLKIGILSPKVYTKNVPNVQVWNFILVPLRTMLFKQVIEVLY